MFGMLRRAAGLAALIAFFLSGPAVASVLTFNFLSNPTGPDETGSCDPGGSDCGYQIYAEFSVDISGIAPGESETFLIERLWSTRRGSGSTDYATVADDPMVSGLDIGLIGPSGTHVSYISDFWAPRVKSRFQAELGSDGTLLNVVFGFDWDRPDIWAHTDMGFLRNAGEGTRADGDWQRGSAMERGTIPLPMGVWLLLGGLGGLAALRHRRVRA